MIYLIIRRNNIDRSYSSLSRFMEWIVIPVIIVAIVMGFILFLAIALGFACHV